MKAAANVGAATTVAAPSARPAVTWDGLDAFAGPGASGTDPRGADVSVEGYVHPVELDDEHSYFVLGPEPACCFGCLPRDPKRAIEVFAARPVPAGGGRVRLTGRLVRLHADAAGWTWQMRDARATPAPPRAAAFPRRRLVAGGALLCLAATAPLRARAQGTPGVDEGRAAVADSVTVDMHSHAGGLAGLRGVREDRPFRPVAAPMRDGGMAAACLAIVSDAPTHRLDPDRRIRPFRDPEPGELFAYGVRCFERLHRMVGEQSLRVVRTASDLRAARSADPSVVVSAEGADFLEGDIGRVDEAHARWQLRHLQLTHYRPNELGDIQTEAPVHNGLTDFGAEVIRRCNALGIVVDVAHGTLDLVKRAAATTTRPLILSHTSLSLHPTARSRLITPEHARVVASTGGVIGVWPPASRFPTMEQLALGILAVADVVGVDHVGLGSDMLGLTGTAIYASYEDTPALSAALLGRGFSAADVRKILGGNYLRVFEQSLSA